MNIEISPRNVGKKNKLRRVSHGHPFSRSVRVINMSRRQEEEEREEGEGAAGGFKGRRDRRSTARSRPKSRRVSVDVVLAIGSSICIGRFYRGNK